MSRCKSCGADIVWVKTVAGKSIPLDAAPVADGNVALDSGGRAHVYSNPAALFVVDMAGDGPRYRSHFATCPNAAEHRR